MKRLQNHVGTWLHHGSDYIKFCVNKLFNNIFVINKRFNNRRGGKMVDIKTRVILWICAVGLAFTVGLIIGERLSQRSIVDDCRIIGATRFGEVYVKCATAQKL